MDRTILHVDMDSYFASVEQQANPNLRNRPIVVTGRPTIRSVVAAASREAKEYGVKSAMSTWKAQKLCSSLIFVPGDPEKYEWVTDKFLDILKSYSPRMEILGIDEAFLDATELASRGEDPKKIAREIRTKTSKALGKYITCSVGIAKNKLLAKLASDLSKPNGITLLRNEQIAQLLQRTPMTELCGIGTRTAKRLNRMGIDNLQQLGEVPLELLKREFGVVGSKLKLMGQGKDPTPVLPIWHEEPTKSVGNSLSLPQCKRTARKALPVLFKLCHTVGYRLRAKELVGKTVRLRIRDENFQVKGKQLTIAQPTNDGNQIYRICEKVREKMVPISTPTMLGVRVSNLSKKSDHPRKIFPRHRQREKLLEVMDSINEEYGKRTIRFASQLPAEDLPRATGSFKRKD